MPVVVEGSSPDDGMDLSGLIEEVLARGFDDLNNTEGRARITRWINQAIREITDYAQWPFLEASIAGTAPLSVPFLGHVLSVGNESGGPLTYLPRSVVAGWDPNFDDTGSASFWYREGTSTLKVYPADTSSTFTVRYLRVPEELSEEGDTPIIPAAYQDLIVDGAVVRALKNRNNSEEAAAVRLEWERGLRQMARSLLHTNYDGPRMVLRTGRPGDYI